MSPQALEALKRSTRHHVLICPSCNGEGYVGGYQCLVCDGDGRLLIPDKPSVFTRIQSWFKDRWLWMRWFSWQ